MDNEYDLLKLLRDTDQFKSAGSDTLSSLTSLAWLIIAPYRPATLDLAFPTS